MKPRFRFSKPSDVRGFTVTELLVVIAVIALITAILLPAVGQLRANARSTSDLSNQRSIVQAYLAYATDNAGYFANPRTTGGSTMVPLGFPDPTHHWVRSDIPYSQAENETNLSAGVLWDYMNATAEGYSSPLDASGRIRSYSLSCYVGVVIPDDWRHNGGTLVPLPDGDTVLNTRTLTKIPRPADTMLSIGEEEQAYVNGELKTIDNRNSFLLDWTEPLWLDVPATWNGTKINISTLDGGVRSLSAVGQSFKDQIAENDGDYLYEWNTVADQPGGVWNAMQGWLLPGRLID